MPTPTKDDLVARLEALQQKRGQTYSLLCALDGAISELSFWLTALDKAEQPPPPPADEPPKE
jgi:hypothetical protein